MFLWHLKRCMKDEQEHRGSTRAVFVSNHNVGCTDNSRCEVVHGPNNEPSPQKTADTRDLPFKSEKR